MTASAPTTPLSPVTDPHHVDDVLDEALDESFPASDPLPVSPGVADPVGTDKPAP